MSKSEVEEKSKEFAKKKEKLTLKAGGFSGYSVKKNKDMYEITIPGKEGFTYTLEKFAPRKFSGEDGIGYTTSSYTD